jgi:hypothetical protein
VGRAGLTLDFLLDLFLSFSKRKGFGVLSPHGGEMAVSLD